jgi:hypothetical protein
MQITFLVNNIAVVLEKDKYPYLYNMATTGGVDYARRVIQDLLKQNGWENETTENQIYSAIGFFESDMVYN